MNVYFFYYRILDKIEIKEDSEVIRFESRVLSRSFSRVLKNKVFKKRIVKKVFFKIKDVSFKVEEI